ncbi:glycosyltransferase family 2 protein [Marinilactibacillus piezotolerans]|uniref:glycosyltransferase family 2 protein n=1 Tax=Marinilactibacillus piezotolerans TaxID=258723 RepID=UPI0009AFE819|nr:glycosyltransferase family A protein [Marinilactibacillus piezotolerans]
MQPLVTAVITTYKRNQQTLDRAIKSVVHQTYKNIELIIVDDNGKESTFSQMTSKLVSGYKDQFNIKHIVNPFNMGVQKSRNNGIENANGEYIAFLDDDDEWLTNKIARQLTPFFDPSFKDLGLVYCWYNELIEMTDGTIKKVQRELPDFQNEKVLVELLRTNYIGSTSFPLIKRTAIEKVGYFDESLEASQDYDMWVRVAKEYSVTCVKEPLVNYYKHQGERITGNPQKKANAEKKFLEKYYSDIKKDHEALSDKTKKIGIYLMRTGKGKEAREYLVQSMRLQPFGVRIYKYYLESFILEAKYRNN